MGQSVEVRGRMMYRNFLLLALVPAIALAQKKPKEVPDGPRGGGAVFSKCGGLFGGSLGGNDRCYEITINKLQVQMGQDGTDDDVSVKICSDDKKTCCTTPNLDKTARDDWRKNNLESWSRSYLGSCKDMKFKIKNGIEVTLQKKGTDSLGVLSLFWRRKPLLRTKKIRRPKGLSAVPSPWTVNQDHQSPRTARPLHTFTRESS